MEDAIVIETGTRISEWALAGVAVVFSAFVVWLAVRIINRRGRWAKRTAIAPAASPVIYVLSFGPAVGQ